MMIMVTEIPPYDVTSLTLSKSSLHANSMLEQVM